MLAGEKIDKLTDEEFIRDQLSREPPVFTKGKYLLHLLVFKQERYRELVHQGQRLRFRFFSGMLFEVSMRYFYIMGKYQDALQCAKHVSESLHAIKGFREQQDFYYTYSLTLLALCKTLRPQFSTEHENGECTTKEGDKDMETTVYLRSQLSIEECLEYINIVIENQNKFKQYSDVAPMNYRHQYLLVEAELARVR